MISGVVMQPHPHPAGYLSYCDRINNFTSEHQASIMRDARDIQRPKPASAPEKGRGPQCGKDRRSATVCPCRCLVPGMPWLSMYRNCLPDAGKRKPPLISEDVKGGCIFFYINPLNMQGCYNSSNFTSEKPLSKSFSSDLDLSRPASPCRQFSLM